MKEREIIKIIRNILTNSLIKFSESISVGDFVSLSDLKKIPITQRHHSADIKYSYNASNNKNASVIFLTGGTSSLNNSIEWYVKDLQSANLPLIKILDSKDLNNSYAFSFVSSNLSSLGNSILNLSEKLNYKLINIGSSSFESIKLAEIFLEKFDVKVIFSTPQGILRLYKTVIPKKLKQIELIILSGGICDNAIHNLVINISPKCCIYDIYGSTETHFIGYRLLPENYFTIFSENVYIENIDSDMIITSLKNTKTPIVRYKLGDIIETLNGNKLKLNGRSSEYFQIGGTKIEYSQFVKFLKEVYNLMIPFQIRFQNGLYNSQINVCIQYNLDDFQTKIMNYLQIENPNLFLKIQSGDVLITTSFLEESKFVLKNDKFKKIIYDE